MKSNLYQHDAEPGGPPSNGGVSPGPQNSSAPESVLAPNSFPGTIQSADLTSKALNGVNRLYLRATFSLIAISKVS